MIEKSTFLCYITKRCHGGLYGKARPENFPTVNDYRNPAVAEGMQILGYVNMLNHGIPEVQRELEENGNGKAVFTIDRITVFEAKLMESGKWRSAVANNPDKLSDKAENVPNQSNNVSNQLPNQLKAMLALISRDPQITYDQLAKELNISRETVRRHIGKLRDDYKIISRSGNARGYWIVLKNDI